MMTIKWGDGFGDVVATGAIVDGWDLRWIGRRLNISTACLLVAI